MQDDKRKIKEEQVKRKKFKWWTVGTSHTFTRKWNPEHEEQNVSKGQAMEIKCLGNFKGFTKLN
jgi:hypothetical protein